MMMGLSNARNSLIKKETIWDQEMYRLGSEMSWTPLAALSWTEYACPGVLRCPSETSRKKTIGPPTSVRKP